jgi:SP family general alpha glucoside:H+ symporter-like MFS transporter
LIILSFLAPESPWWLVRNGKLQEAERSLKRLGGKAMQTRAHEQVANMVRTTQLENDLAETTGSGRWIDIFKGTDLRRTEITVFVWVLQNFSGAMFAGNTTYVFQQAGISQQVAYDLGWGTSAIQLGANFLNMFLLYHFGRRTIYMAGFAYCSINLIIVGVAAVYGIRGNDAARWVQAGVQMVSLPPSGLRCARIPLTH